MILKGIDLSLDKDIRMQSSSMKKTSGPPLKNKD